MRLPTCKTLIAATFCCVIAGFAAHSTVAAKTLFAAEGNTVMLESADDPLRNGLRILNTHQAESPRLLADNDETVLLLDQWTFSSKGKPSPYH